MSAKPEHYDVIRKPIVTEKSTMASENGAVVFEVAIHRHQRQGQTLPWSAGPSGGCQESLCDTGRRQHDRRDHRSLILAFPTIQEPPRAEVFFVSVCETPLHLNDFNGV